MYLPSVQPWYATKAVPGVALNLPNQLFSADLDFFNEDTALFYYPAALYSAGVDGNLSRIRNGKEPKPCMVTNRDKGGNFLVLGDSGGFQAIHGEMEFSDEMRKKVARWQYDHMTAGVILDHPTKSIIKGTANDIDVCLRNTIPSLDYAQEWYRDPMNTTRENRTFKSPGGDVTIPFGLLNVLQGNDDYEVGQWWQAVKDYRLGGWCFAGDMKGNLPYVLRRMKELVDTGRINEQECWIHFLGIGELEFAVLLTQILNSTKVRLRQHGVEMPNLILTFDTSNPWSETGRRYDILSGYKLESDNWSFSHSDYVNERGAPDDRFPYRQTRVGRRMLREHLVGRNKDNRPKLSLGGLSLAANHNLEVSLQAYIAANKAVENRELDKMSGRLLGVLNEIKAVLEDDKEPDDKLLLRGSVRLSPKAARAKEAHDKKQHEGMTMKALGLDNSY